MLKSASQPPLSIRLIALWFFLEALFQGAVICVSRVSTHWADFIFRPWAIRELFWVLIVILLVWTAFSLWRLNNVARQIAIGLEICNLPITLWNLSLPLKDPGHFGIGVTFALFMLLRFNLVAAYLCTIIRSGLFLWFLIKRKSTFVRGNSGDTSLNSTDK